MTKNEVKSLQEKIKTQGDLLERIMQESFELSGKFTENESSLAINELNLSILSIEHGGINIENDKIMTEIRSKEKIIAELKSKIEKDRATMERLTSEQISLNKESSESETKLATATLADTSNTIASDPTPQTTKDTEKSKINPATNNKSLKSTTYNKIETERVELCIETLFHPAITLINTIESYISNNTVTLEVISTSFIITPTITKIDNTKITDLKNIFSTDDPHTSYLSIVDNLKDILTNSKTSTLWIDPCFNNKTKLTCEYHKKEDHIIKNKPLKFICNLILREIESIENLDNKPSTDKSDLDILLYRIAYIIKLKTRDVKEIVFSIKSEYDIINQITTEYNEHWSEVYNKANYPEFLSNITNAKVLMSEINDITKSLPELITKEEATAEQTECKELLHSLTNLNDKSKNNAVNCLNLMSFKKDKELKRLSSPDRHKESDIMAKIYNRFHQVIINKMDEEKEIVKQNTQECQNIDDSTNEHDLDKLISKANPRLFKILKSKVTYNTADNLYSFFNSELFVTHDNTINAIVDNALFNEESDIVQIDKIKTALSKPKIIDSFILSKKNLLSNLKT